MKKIYVILIIVVLILFLIPLIVVATKNILMYNPENGKPVVVAGEEAPEELVGKEVSLLVPIEPEIIEDIENQIMSEDELKEIEKITTEDEINPEDDVIRKAAEEEKNKMEKFYDILSDYYGADLINKIKKEMSTDITGEFPKSGKTLLNCVIQMYEDENVIKEDKLLLKDVAQTIVKLNKINDDELERKINDL